MDAQDTLLETFRSVKRQRRATSRVDPDTAPGFSRKPPPSDALNAPRRTLFFPVRQDPMVEKCKGVPEWRVRAPIPTIHACGAGVVYVMFSSLEAALNYAKVLRTPPKPPRPRRSGSRKRKEVECDDESLLHLVVNEGVEDAFLQVLGEDLEVGPSTGSEDASHLECEEDALSNADSDLTDTRSEIGNKFSIRTVQQIPSHSRPERNALYTVLFRPHTRQPLLPFFIASANQKGRRGASTAH